MNMMQTNWIPAIPKLNDEVRQAALDHQNQLTKPQGSLGVLEQLSMQLAAITGQLVPDIEKRAVIVMAGDHGVCAEGVSAFPAEVTPQMVMNFVHGGAAVNVLARQAGADVYCVDIGVNADLEHPNLLSRKVKRGTANMAKEAAMSHEEAEAAIRVGIEVAEQLIGEGYRLIATGEMGIGNTTASSAMLCAFTGLHPEDTVGRGTGIGDELWKHKCDVVRQALHVNTPDPNDALDVLAKVGGLEIGGLVGVIIGAAKHGVPIVIDGFISSVAALAAVRLVPDVHPYLISSHLSEERGHLAVLREMELQPVLHLNMRLGEGTGAVLAFPLLDSACSIMREMATFAQAGVSGKEA
ncbi:nicotinate-nucleotide--dimethylbenzimidazole phosphoribosyltransferase [Paenibacillus arenosi]|uniref:Nicotinate-nucleotide--dimethylbenzimidazole phosphoribosyltransferase n=1 Tax=Paenibacillus arenosi TaxID=2774142 RepID=A0ABR9B3I3_9BACL|nr:nicotinate-nucleotide--dimethylbenzimidazole phosphoribosyltransferase [Paenibacillus arenosi]MBD8500045.1 nicotinate-nucleotide--dimethylbenzimidazole phosphoribosyltransferase [Paenibacillus arenosi]